MVTRGSLSDCSNSSDVNEDTASVATSDSDDGSHHDELVLAEDAHKEKPSFGNIAVTNSTDIHFGNKTYYQGPVTIKQFLYANPQISCDEASDADGGGINDNKLAINNGVVIADSVPDSVVGEDNESYVPDKLGINTKNDIDKIVNVDIHHPEVTKGTQWLRNFSRRHLILIVSLAAVLLVSLVTLMTVLLTRHQTGNSNNYIFPEDTNEQETGSPSQYPVDPNVSFTLPGKVKYVSRKEWLAQPPMGAITPLHLPVPYVIISHTATEDCSDQAACTFHVRFIQTFHIESRNWSDIGYNFLVGGDGNAYEGRGFKGQGAHTYGYNSKSIGIAFVGTFNQVLPPERQIFAAQKIIEKGVKEKYIAENYKLLAARQLQATQSPGLKLYENMKTWSHWAKAP